MQIKGRNHVRCQPSHVPAKRVESIDMDDWQEDAMCMGETKQPTDDVVLPIGTGTDNFAVVEEECTVLSTLFNKCNNKTKYV